MKTHTLNVIPSPLHAADSFCQCLVFTLEKYSRLKTAHVATAHLAEIAAAMSSTSWWEKSTGTVATEASAKSSREGFGTSTAKSASSGLRFVLNPSHFPILFRAPMCTPFEGALPPCELLLAAGAFSSFRSGSSCSSAFFSKLARISAMLESLCTASSIASWPRLKAFCCDASATSSHRGCAFALSFRSLEKLPEVKTKCKEFGYRREEVRPKSPTQHALCIR